jgi:hypothetical protein
LSYRFTHRIVPGVAPGRWGSHSRHDDRGPAADAHVVGLLSLLNPAQ